MGYLVMSRRTNERIAIRLGDETVEILISDILRDKVDLAFKAPKHIKIERLCTHLEEQSGNVSQSRNKSRQRHPRRRPIF